jgi:CRP-like cAMP-binding protein
MAHNASESRFALQYSAGQTIFREGDSGSDMFIIKTGRVGIWKEIEGERTTLTVLEKGDFFGEMSLLEGQPRAANVEALDEVELIRIDGTTFNNMIRNNVEIAVRMMRKLAARLRQSNNRIEELLEAQGQARKEPEPEPAPAPPSPSAARLVAESGREFALGTGETMIGRYDPVTGLRPEVDLSEEERGRSVSRRHARIVLRDGTYYLAEEVGTLNPTLLNGSKLDTGILTPLKTDDEISVGGVRLSFKPEGA